MIIKFEEYYVNESILNKSWALAFFLLFNNLTGDMPRRYDMEYFQNYVKTLNVANNDYIYKRVLEEAKRKVTNDPHINNKADVIKKMNSLMVIYKKDDEFSNVLFKLIDKNNNIENTFTKATVIQNQIMILNKSCRPEEIYHELMHVAFDISNSNEDITKFFNFKNTVEKQKLITSRMTDSVWNIQPTTNIKFINYLSQPTEIYARLNEFKFFLFRNKIINSPYQNLPTKIVYDLINGKIYRKLNIKEQQKFPYCHFIELFKFLDISKIEKMK